LANDKPPGACPYLIGGLAPFPVGGARYSGEPQVFVSADTRKKALFGKKAKVLNI